MNQSDKDYSEWQLLCEKQFGLTMRRGSMVNSLLRHLEMKPELLPSQIQGQKELESSAVQELIEAITVQHSWFFRDEQQLLMGCAALKSGDHIWVPACARGEEPSSLAAICAERGLSVSILGTDLCARAVREARSASYDHFATQSIPAKYARYFELVEGRLVLAPAYRVALSFEVQNLLEPPPRSGHSDGLWDLIVCRNVFIYFSPEQVQRVLLSFGSALRVGGRLILGASDFLTSPPPTLRAVVEDGRVYFQKLGASAQLAEPGLLAPWGGHLQASLKPELARPAASTKLPSESLGSSQARLLPPILTPVPVETHEPAPSSRRIARVHALEPGEAPNEPGPSSEREASDETLAGMHLIRGMELELAGEVQQAMRELRMALYLLPSAWPAAYYLALCYEELGRKDEARREYAHVCRLVEGATEEFRLPGMELSFLTQDVIAIARQRAQLGP